MIGLLLSGGMDSTCIAWWKRPDVAITVDYGQKPAEGEIQAAKTVCATLSIRHEVVRVDCSSLGSGDMAGSAAMPMAPVPEWWPYRNQLIITLAGSVAISIGVTEMMIGALMTDGAHADGRPDFIEAISRLMALQEGGLIVSAPAISLDAVSLVRESTIPQGVLAWAHSCHVASLACGQCRGCVKHYHTWKALGWDAH
jgi:7-cyano-7-deazaguanine synthase